MKIKIEIDCDNAAFIDDPAANAERIAGYIGMCLRQYCDFRNENRLADCDRIVAIRDTNGNKCGTFRRIGK